jgi:hypothetical protein
MSRVFARILLPTATNAFPCHHISASTVQTFSSLPNEVSEDYSNDNCLKIIDNNKIFLSTNDGISEKTVVFDKVFSKCDRQEELYGSMRDLVEAGIAGHTATIFSFGVAGAGKTFTLFGNEQQLGLVHFSLKDLFLHIEEEEQSKNNHVYIEMSYLELYNNHFHNLLRNVQKPNKSIENFIDNNKNNEINNSENDTKIENNANNKYFEIVHNSTNNSDKDDVSILTSTSTFKISVDSCNTNNDNKSNNKKNNKKNNCSNSNITMTTNNSSYDYHQDKEVKKSVNKEKLKTKSCTKNKTYHDNDTKYINEKIEIHESVDFGVFLSGFESLKVSIDNFDEAIYYIDQGFYFLFFIIFILLDCFKFRNI